jgi:hypothetical protein
MVTTAPNQQELLVYQVYAKNAFDSQMYRSVGKESAIMMLLLSGREYGIPPAQALNGAIQIIEGKVELAARTMSGLIRRSGHQLKITEGPDHCVVWGKRKDTGEEHEVKYTMEMAQRAGLIKDKGAWKKSQEDMLYNRAMSRLARRLFPDVIGIGYVQGEISDPGASNEVLELSFTANSFEQNMEELAKNFSIDEMQELGLFVTDFCKHFKTDVNTGINRLVMDIEKTKENFQKWKNKRKSNDEIS